MNDWNNNGKIDPEEIFLTDEILREKDEEYKAQAGKPSGCLLTLITLPFLFILKGLRS